MARIATANGVSSTLTDLVPAKAGRTVNLETLYVHNPQATDVVVNLIDGATLGVIWQQPVPAGGIAACEFCREKEVSPLIALVSSGGKVSVQTASALAGGLNVTVTYGRVAG